MKKAIIIFIIATLFLAFLYLVQPLVKAAEVKDDITGYFSDKGVTITTTSRAVEQTVVDEYKKASPVSKLLGTHEAKLTSLGEVTINDLVMDTYFPLGEETPDATKSDFDPFRNITIETPGKQWWDIHPSEEETAAYKNQLISDWEAAKEAAWYASLTDTPTPAPTGSATPAPTKTPGPKPSPGPKPVVAPAPIPPVLTPSPAPTLAPSGTPTPAPTMQPTPEPPDFSLTAEELAEVEKEVDAWYKANSRVEERDITTSVSFNGEKIREYINSYHPEWQVAYILSFMVEYFHDENPGGDETQISADVAEQICDQLIRGYGYELMIDYWSSGWGDKWDANKRTLSLEEGDLYSSYRDAVTGADVMVKLFDKIEMDYSENRREDEPDLLKEEWIEPFVLFRNIYAWSENLSFGDREGGVNEFGFYEQKLNSKSVGSIFLEIVSAYDFPNTELALMQDALEEMPESAYALTRWAFAMGSIKGREGGGYLVDRETITWLAGDDIGTRISLLALDQVGKIYSNDLRNKEGYFDCSSLTHFLYKSVGINIAWDGSDVAASQCKWSDQTKKTKWTYYNEAEMIPGDLIFWETKNTKHVSYSRYKHVYHVGVYIGNGIIVDASSSVGCVVCREMWGIDKVVGVARPYE